jgi:hypothetical protein
LALLIAVIVGIGEPRPKNQQNEASANHFKDRRDCASSAYGPSNVGPTLPAERIVVNHMTRLTLKSLIAISIKIPQFVQNGPFAAIGARGQC